MIAATPELAIEALQRCKMVETSDERTADCAVSMLQSTSDGVDILLIPKNGDVKHEVRLRVKKVELLVRLAKKRVARWKDKMMRRREAIRKIVLRGMKVYGIRDEVFIPVLADDFVGSSVDRGGLGGQVWENE
jgi:hypothetical protein